MLDRRGRPALPAAIIVLARTIPDARPVPGIPSGLGFSIPARATTLRSVDWADVSVPGSVCGAGKPIRLHDGTAFTKSAVEPWWPVVEGPVELAVTFWKLSYGILRPVQTAIGKSAE